MLFIDFESAEIFCAGLISTLKTNSIIFSSSLILKPLTKTANFFLIHFCNIICLCCLNFLFVFYFFILPCGKNIVQNNWHDMRYDRKWWLKPPERSSRDFFIEKTWKNFYFSLKMTKEMVISIPIIELIMIFLYKNIETRTFTRFFLEIL